MYLAAYREGIGIVVGWWGCNVGLYHCHGEGTDKSVMGKVCSFSQVDIWSIYEVWLLSLSLSLLRSNVTNFHLSICAILSRIVTTPAAYQQDHSSIARTHIIITSIRHFLLYLLTPSGSRFVCLVWFVWLFVFVCWCFCVCLKVRFVGALFVCRLFELFLCLLDLFVGAFLFETLFCACLFVFCLFVWFACWCFVYLYCFYLSVWLVCLFCLVLCFSWCFVCLLVLCLFIYLNCLCFRLRVFVCLLVVALFMMSRSPKGNTQAVCSSLVLLFLFSQFFFVVFFFLLSYFVCFPIFPGSYLILYCSFCHNVFLKHRPVSACFR